MSGGRGGLHPRSLGCDPVHAIVCKVNLRYVAAIIMPYRRSPTRALRDRSLHEGARDGQPRLPWVTGIGHRLPSRARSQRAGMEWILPGGFKRRPSRSPLRPSHAALICGVHPSMVIGRLYRDGVITSSRGSEPHPEGPSTPRDRIEDAMTAATVGGHWELPSGGHQPPGGGHHAACCKQTEPISHLSSTYRPSVTGGGGLRRHNSGTPEGAPSQPDGDRRVTSFGTRSLRAEHRIWREAR
jgi:hypothetical protein